MNLVGWVNTPTTEFCDHGINFEDTKTYYITWIDLVGTESDPVEITIP